MKKILLKLVAILVRQAVDSDLFDVVKGLVLAQVDTDLSGEEKKEIVHTRVNDMLGEGKKVASSTINIIIETVLAGKFGV